MTSTMKPTKFGQQLLNMICDHVAPVCGMGFIGWSIGKEPEVVRWLAAQLDRPVKSIAGGVADLVEKGFIRSGHGITEGHYDFDDNGTIIGRVEDIETTYNIVSVTHDGWQQYTLFDVSKFTYDPDDLETWLEWDGVDGLDYPFAYDKPDWRVKRKKAATR